MFNIYKLIFLTTLFIGTLISISSHSWLGTWIGLEINLLSFIPLLNKKNDPYSSESSIKYFLVQALASTIFLFSILLSMIKNNLISEMIIFNKFMIMMINSSLFLKMGAAPFHFWFPSIIEGLNWMNSMILMTWQKIAPMILLSYTIKMTNYIFFIIISCTFIGSIGGLNQVSLRKILAYSSINHIGWMISTFINNENLWMNYFMVYSFITITLTLMFNKFNIFFIKQLFFLMTKNYFIKFLMMINMLSLGGLPPFLGFLPKWFIIQSLSYSNMFLILFMIMMSLITLYYYMRIIYSSMMIYHNELNFNLMLNNITKNNSMNMMLTFMSINGLMFYTIFFNFF